MITRFALFEGSINDDKTDAFRNAVLERLVPLWKQFPGATDVKVMFSDDRDPGAPEYPLILAISYPDTKVMEQALESPFRYESKEVTGEIVDEFFIGRIHHHVTAANSFLPG